MDLLQDLYAILGVPPTADEEQIRQAYRWAARHFHPDVNNSPGAAVLFRDVNAAYEILSNSRNRAEYDTLRGDRSLDSNLSTDVYLWQRHVVRLEEPQLIHALTTIRPVATATTLTSNAPLNLCLVIDRSNSMAGERLSRVKAAAHHIIDEASDNDIISVVTFSDKAEVIIPATYPHERRTMKAMISTIRADGATAIFSGLRLAVEEIERHRTPRYVNHIILITDGRTYGDEEACLELASQAHHSGIGISGMGIGEDWNDRFLDAIASRTGGSSAYIASPATVSRFLRDRIRTLATAYAERARLVVASTSKVSLASVFRLSPHPMELEAEPQPIPLGTIDSSLPTSLLFKFHVNASDTEFGELFIGRIDVTGDLLGSENRTDKIITDLRITVGPDPIEEEPPPQLIDALSRLTLYRLQERARDAMDRSDFAEATRKLEFLATRLFESGEEELGQAALHEARRIAQTRAFSEEGAKRLKYGTRAFLLPPGESMGEST